MNKELKIKVILGSIRVGRFGERPARWVYDELARHNEIDAELLDLKDYPMPFFDAPMSPSMMGKKYQNEIVQRWSAKIDEADGYVIVSPEYNHGYSGVLKNAMDSISPEWYRKPVGFVSYGSAGGARAIEQLRQVVIELKMIPINKSIHIPWEFIMKAMNNKEIKHDELLQPLRTSMGPDHLQAFIENLVWMTKAMKQVREEDKK